MDFISSIFEYLSTPIILGTLELPFNWLKLAAAVIISIIFYVIYRLLVLLTRRVPVFVKEVVAYPSSIATPSLDYRMDKRPCSWTD